MNSLMSFQEQMIGMKPYYPRSIVCIKSKIVCNCMVLDRSFNRLNYNYSCVVESLKKLMNFCLIKKIVHDFFGIIFGSKFNLI